MVERILSVQEIGEIERGYALGIPALGFAAKEFLRRWQFGLKDEETLIRLVFLFWYSRTEPPFLTGLNNEFDGLSVERLLEEFGGEDRLGRESRFIIAMLGYGEYAFGLGDETEWRAKSTTFLRDAGADEPQSFLFADWKFFIDEAPDTKSLKTKIETEIHARFAGRGYMGDYLIHILSAIVRPNQIGLPPNTDG